MPRAALCAELIALPCAVCACWRCHVLIASIGVIFGGKDGGPKEDNQIKKSKKRQVDTYIHTGRHRVSYCCMFERRHSAARHSTAGQGTARHRAAPHGAALLSYSWAELSCESICFVIQHIYSTWYVQQGYRWYDSWNDTCHVQQKARSTAQHGTAPHSSTAPHGMARAWHGRARPRAALHGATLLS